MLKHSFAVPFVIKVRLLSVLSIIVHFSRADRAAPHDGIHRDAEAKTTVRKRSAGSLKYLVKTPAPTVRGWTLNQDSTVVTMVSIPPSRESRQRLASLVSIVLCESPIIFPWPDWGGLVSVPLTHPARCLLPSSSSLGITAKLPRYSFTSPIEVGYSVLNC
ncbi:hypothetical protein F5X96DRAFT_160916 [Biscogniauxia mediterranea]|nr:hypothetical protein F5X96DRAFT_160916 [Biscogniauxia mediterranea]